MHSPQDCQLPILDKHHSRIDKKLIKCHRAGTRWVPGSEARLIPRSPDSCIWNIHLTPATWHISRGVARQYEYSPYYCILVCVTLHQEWRDRCDGSASSITRAGRTESGPETLLQGPWCSSHRNHILQLAKMLPYLLARLTTFGRAIHT